MADHLSPAELEAAAAGDPEARARTARHASACPSCRQRLARLLGVIEAAAEALGPGRAGCPPPEVLADLPPGAEADNPHVAGCPLCRADLDLLHALEARGRLGELLSERVPHRPTRFVEHGAGYIQSAPGASLKMAIESGAKKSGSVAGAAVALEVAHGALVVTVSGDPDVELELLVENDSMERVVRLEKSPVSVDAGRWLRAEVRRSRKT